MSEPFSPVCPRYQNGHRTDQSELPDLYEPLPSTIEAILRHKSTRNFQSDPLPPNTLETLVAAGQSASTSSMLQTWSVVAVADQERKAKVATLAGDQDFIREAPLFLVFCADLSRLTNMAQREGLPDKALAKMDMFLMASIDAALASQNVALAAEALGLGICYVGAARNNSRELCRLLGLPQRVIALFGMSIGKADPNFLTSIKPRLSQREVLHRECWDDAEQDKHIESYNETLGSFYEDEGKHGRGTWSRHSSEFIATEQLDGREIIRDVIEERGFSLR